MTLDYNGNELRLGDKVRVIEHSGYSRTNENGLYEIIEIYSEEEITVRIIEHEIESYIGEEHTIYANKTIKEEEIILENQNCELCGNVATRKYENKFFL